MCLGRETAGRRLHSLVLVRFFPSHRVPESVLLRHSSLDGANPTAVAVPFSSVYRGWTAGQRSQVIALTRFLPSQRASFSVLARPAERSRYRALILRPPRGTVAAMSKPPIRDRDRKPPRP